MNNASMIVEGQAKYVAPKATSFARRRFGVEAFSAAEFLVRMVDERETRSGMVAAVDAPMLAASVLRAAGVDDQWVVVNLGAPLPEVERFSATLRAKDDSATYGPLSDGYSDSEAHATVRNLLAGLRFRAEERRRLNRDPKRVEAVRAAIQAARAAEVEIEPEAILDALEGLS